MKNVMIALLTSVFLISCSSTQYKPIIDPNNGKTDDVVQKDILECTEIAKTVDLK